MAKSGKPSSGARRPRHAALRQLQEALGLSASNWQAFAKHAQDGLADYEQDHWRGPPSAFRLEEAPNEWLFLLRPEKNSRCVEMVQQGALDVVEAHAAELGSQEVRKWLRKAIKGGGAIVRQTAYRIGLEQFGEAFARPALKDPAKVVSSWAVKALAGTTRRPRDLWE